MVLPHATDVAEVGLLCPVVQVEVQHVVEGEAHEEAREQAQVGRGRHEDAEERPGRNC
eukprot:CAMPEP_0173262580 /NCGR_PEP_ID=MMETSP1142-20121109/26860_1 /TAXON_ID=483371 /ORGANISM="non described non described, Strain CCMP2298" /LENGTH=57 /DNA_ID=CAMNT_0014197747 /DNA_START=135 /DNA_END=308 /DNA_ORIENTATION=+